VLVFEPPHRLVFSWNIGPTWQLEDPGHASEVELRFLPEGPDHTRVELEHRHLDRHGPGWPAVHEGVDSDQGWPLYLARYASPAGGIMTSVSIEVESPANRGLRLRDRSHEVPRVAARRGQRLHGQQGRDSGRRPLPDNRRIGGSERPATSELVRLDPPQTWAVPGIDGPIRAHVDLSVEPLTDQRSGSPSPSTSWYTA
jgi:hypothetical protein